jgi:hypothetical protein
MFTGSRYKSRHLEESRAISPAGERPSPMLTTKQRESKMKNLVVPCLLAAPLCLASACGVATTSLKSSLAAREPGDMTIATARDRLGALQRKAPMDNPAWDMAVQKVQSSIGTKKDEELATRQVTNDLETLTRMVAVAENPTKFDVNETDRAKELKATAQLLLTRANSALNGTSSTLKPSHRLAWEQAKLQATLADGQADFALDTKQDSKDRRSALENAGRHLEQAKQSIVEGNLETELVYSSYFKLHGGAATFRPYRFQRNDTGTRFLTTDSTTAFYAEMDFLYRTAWLEPGRVRTDLLEEGAMTRLIPQDYEFRLGFINQAKVSETGSATAPTGIDGSKDAADGDWYAEATIGWVLGMENISLNPADRNLDVPRGTWGPELFGNLQTDRNGFNTTGSYMFGLGTAWAIPISVGNVKRFATMAGGLYVGIHEYPRVDDDNGIYSDDAIVHFNRLGSFGVRLDFMVPITNGLDAVVEARHYSPLTRNDIADDWSLFVGASIPIGRLVRDVLQ